MLCPHCIRRDAPDGEPTCGNTHCREAELYAVDLSREDLSKKEARGLQFHYRRAVKTAREV